MYCVNVNGQKNSDCEITIEATFRSCKRRSYQACMRLCVYIFGFSLPMSLCLYVRVCVVVFVNLRVRKTRLQKEREK